MINNIKQIPKWYRMVTGKSVFHAMQPKGKFFETKRVRGYYNDLTAKVLNDCEMDKYGIPINIRVDGKVIYFPIAIFQYGLGAYDLYLQTGEKKYKEKFLNMVNWAIKNQREDGSWNTFGMISSEYRDISAMGQGEGASLLSRAYIEENNEIYLKAAIKAIDLMVSDIDSNGTCRYEDDYIILEEYVKNNKIGVLNGAIFATFALIDVNIILENQRYKSLLEKSIKFLKENINLYDSGYWSKYDQNNNIASPFYHKLHIEQLDVLYDITGEEIFMIYRDKWKKYQANKINYYRAFLVKAIQKVFMSTGKNSLVE